MPESKRVVNRREFVGTAAKTAAATSILPLVPQMLHAAPKRRYAIVGTGIRACFMWGRDLVQDYSDVVDFVGLCDINRKRVDVAKRMIETDCPTFTDFDKMCNEARPDLLMVTTVDAEHSGYIVKALERGLEVITEKPMVIDETQCQAILDAEKRTGRKIIVTFNYRYAPKAEKVKQILMSGAIGRVLSVDFNWYLDVYHGASYFRRWHRLRDKGGTLLVHKATHHFDLVNWWLDAEPVEVTASGDLKFYGKRGPYRHTHCRPCMYKDSCRFYLDITRDETLMELYVSCESEDGYLRDGCVFREDVDIYDAMSVIVRYSNDVTMNYSLNAFLPFEGHRIAFNGERGRLEVRDYERQPWDVSDETEIYVTTSFDRRQKIEVPRVEGGHSGGDVRLHDTIWRGKEIAPYLTLPDSRAGALSCLTGIAARKSIEEKRTVRIDELVAF
jgi:predicted dehydrogenase